MLVHQKKCGVVFVAQSKDERRFVRAFMACIKFGGRLSAKPKPKDQRPIAIEMDGHFSGDH